MEKTVTKGSMQLVQVNLKCLKLFQNSLIIVAYTQSKLDFLSCIFYKISSNINQQIDTKQNPE